MRSDAQRRQQAACGIFPTPRFPLATFLSGIGLRWAGAMGGAGAEMEAAAKTPEPEPEHSPLTHLLWMVAFFALLQVLLVHKVALPVWRRMSPALRIAKRAVRNDLETHLQAGLFSM